VVAEGRGRVGQAEIITQNGRRVREDEERIQALKCWQILSNGLPRDLGSKKERVKRSEGSWSLHWHLEQERGLVVV